MNSWLEMAFTEINKLSYFYYCGFGADAAAIVGDPMFQVPGHVTIYTDYFGMEKFISVLEKLV